MFPHLSRVSAAAGLLGLGGLGGAALAARPNPEPARVAAALPHPRSEVRTVVVHRTVHVYRKPKRRHLAPAPAVSASAPPPAPVPVAPAAVRVLAPAPRAQTPLVTRTSGAGGSHEGDDRGERERGDD